MDSYTHGELDPKVNHGPAQPPIPTTSSEEYEKEQRLKAMRETLGMDTMDIGTDELLSYLYDELGDEDIDKKLRELSNKIGGTVVGREKVRKMYNYVKLLKNIEGSLLRGI